MTPPISLYIGIDNGLAGGIAAYFGTGELRVTPMPVVGVKKAKGSKSEYNIPAILQWFDQLPCAPKMVVLEKAHSMPLQGIVSTFSIGRSFGIMEGILAARKFPYMIVAAKTWQAKMFEGIAHTDTKQSSVLVAQRLFPDTDLRVGPRSNKLHDGLSDAMLMAYYSYLLFK